METGLSAAVALREAPSRFLDAGKWAELRLFASSELGALTYINAQYPNENDPSAFFWGRDGSFEQALRCYELGRALLEECRLLLIQGKLIAVGSTPDGNREMIRQLSWLSLWPMFATGRAYGRNTSYNEVELYSAPTESPDQKILFDCMAWLRVQKAQIPNQPKKVLIHRARTEFVGQLTETIFDAAYKIVYGLKRGRRRISPQH